MKDHAVAGHEADQLIASEVGRQDRMWGVANERADTHGNQLLHAAMAQLDAVDLRLAGIHSAFESIPAIYPPDWTGFRDYGSTVANLVVAAAFLRQEIKRRIAAGEDTTRLSRDQVKQPYTGDQPAVQEA